ncbi:MAG: acyl-CoA desaturase [Rubrivivax sp.]|nr:MAG: acyl-CoA desaturase [Rubrivivax sp.]
MPRAGVGSPATGPGFRVLGPASSPADRTTPGPQTEEAFAAFARELDQVRDDTRRQLGEVDAAYIKRLLYAIRIIESAGRGLLTLAGVFWPAWLAGTALLGLSKCLENMEFGHNVMHGQYDWLNDRRFDGKTHDWDNACAKDDWRHFHNHMHHHYTNVLGVDRDFGYGMMRLSNDVPWERRNLTQALYAIIVAFTFEWAIAIHNMEVEQLRGPEREAARERMLQLWPAVKAKMGRQIRRDYILWPLLGGLAALALGQGFVAGLVASLLGHVVANVLRNLWTFAVIFCGHFTDQIHTFDPADVVGESKGHWYLRQCLGSANISGGKVFHLLTGNLSHQIEHHLYPDIPARRYAEMAPRVREICQRHGVPYHTGFFGRQMVTVAWRILRHAFPGGQRTLSAMAASRRSDAPLQR